MPIISAILLLIGTLSIPVLSIPIDNAVLGEPEIECGSSGIQVNVNVKNPFEGVVFSKNAYKDANCKAVNQIGKKYVGIAMDFGSCNIRRRRSLDPRGVFATVTVIVSFHYKFITKVDRAYRIECFYMEADKTVNQALNVSMLTSVSIPYNVPMPTCKYEILDSMDGLPLKYAVVGQPAFHKWSCDTTHANTFCIKVHSCFVDDGMGKKVALLDKDGCSLDRHLLGNLMYISDLMAGKETHVFKYADKPQLYFQCQIALSIKDPESDCLAPMCRSSANRTRRELRMRDEHNAENVDVLAEMNIIQLNSTQDYHDQYDKRTLRDPGMCLSWKLMTGFICTVIIAACSVITALILRKIKK